MSIQICFLGSGSEGNCLLLRAGRTSILIDCGLGLKESEARLLRKGVAAEEITGILCTHEHSDHSSGIAKLARRFNIPVWCTYGTWLACPGLRAAPIIHTIVDFAKFSIGELDVEPFPVPHDAREPCQFVFYANGYKVGLVTDIGYVTPEVLRALSESHALIIEFNHDVEMLLNSKYPENLKNRILGPFGHLDNEASMSLVKSLKSERLEVVVAAHLSKNNNKPELVREKLSEVLKDTSVRYALADQDLGTEWISIGL